MAYLKNQFLILVFGIVDSCAICDIFLLKDNLERIKRYNKMYLANKGIAY